MAKEVTLEELKSKLVEQDEITLLELLDLRSNDIVNMFSDLVEDKSEALIEELFPEDDITRSFDPEIEDNEE